MHCGAAHQSYVSIRKIVGLLICSTELIQADLCDRIQAIIFHIRFLRDQAFSASNFFMNSTSFSTPSIGIAL